MVFTRVLGFSDILSVNADEFAASGIIVDGMSSFVGVAVFTIFLMGLIGTLQKDGLIEWLMEKSVSFAKGPRSAETSIVGLTLLVNALTTAGTPTMVMLGPFVRRLGHKFRLTPWRRGNLLDACSTSIIGFLPYSVAVLIPFALVSDTVADANLTNFSPFSLVPFVFYCWALMLTIIVAAVTGWGRDFMGDDEYEIEEGILNTEDESGSQGAEEPVATR